MGGTTTNGYPYVTPDDHPQVYPAASQQLAETIETKLGRGIQKGTITPASGWIDFGQSWAGLWCTRVGDVVTIDCLFGNTAEVTVSTAIIIGTLPAGFYPGHTVEGLCNCAGQGVQRLNVYQTGGQIQLNPLTAPFTLPAGQFVAVNISYRAA